MHIAHVITNFSTKLNYQEHYLIEKQIEDENNVTVLTSQWNPGFPNYEEVYKPMIGDRFVGLGLYREQGYNVIRLLLHNKPSIFSYLEKLTLVLKIIKPNLIICHGFESGLICIQCALSRIPTIVDSHYVKLHDDMFPQKIRYKRLIRPIVNKCKPVILSKYNVKYVGVTEDSVKSLLNSGARPADVHMIPLAVDETHFAFNESDRRLVRGRLGLDDRDFLIITTGKIEEYKGIHLIIEAVLKLQKEDIYVLIVGKAGKEYGLELKRISNNISGNIFYHEYASRAELVKLFCASDIAVYAKSISISHIEAMSVGLPIIVSDQNAVQHRVEYGNGFTVVEGDIVDLARKIEVLYYNPDLRKEMGRKSRRLVEEKLGARIMNQRFMDLFPDL